MIKWCRVLVLGLIFCPLVYGYKNCYITTRYHPGRFGDQLVLYIKAKLLSRITGIPLLYKSFTYADQLVLSTVDQRCTAKKTKKLELVSVQDVAAVLRDPHADSCLYMVGFFTRIFPSGAISSKTFVQELQELICPKKKLWEPTLPHDRITIAMHVRKGGGYTIDKVAQYVFAHKFLSEDFYIESLNRLIGMFPGRPLYVHVFTDDPDPLTIVDRIREGCDPADIQFDCRRDGNAYDQNVLEDFFAMMKFDCLIRSASSFSRIAELLGNHKVVISSSCLRRGNPVSLKLDRILDTPSGVGQLAGIVNLVSWIYT